MYSSLQYISVISYDSGTNHIFPKAQKWQPGQKYHVSNNRIQHESDPMIHSFSWTCICYRQHVLYIQDLWPFLQWSNHMFIAIAGSTYLACSPHHGKAPFSFDFPDGTWYSQAQSSRFTTRNSIVDNFSSDIPRCTLSEAHKSILLLFCIYWAAFEDRVAHPETAATLGLSKWQ